ncbi:MAG: 23S rRNA (guanosine(2251)-2'-O)-methyltransferase RlmB [Patescibacteria group bacterium]
MARNTKLNRLYGRNSILGRLKENPKSIKKLLIEKDIRAGDVEQICKSENIPVCYVPEREFNNISGDIRAQGIIAEVEHFRYASFEDVLDKSLENLPVILFLDNLNDPQNLGGILRSAACFGGFAVVLPKYDSVEVTDAVLRVAQGGENYVPACQVNNLSWAIETAKKAGYWIAGAVVEAGEDLTGVRLNFPLGLVIGSEAKGIRQGLLKHLDLKLTIPMQKTKLSFNVSIATALFCYEVYRQRKKVTKEAQE